MHRQKFVFWHILKFENSQVAKLNSRENLLLEGNWIATLIYTCQWIATNIHDYVESSFQFETSQQFRFYS